MCPINTAIGEFQVSKVSQKLDHPFFMVFWLSATQLVAFGAITLLQAMLTGSSILPSSWLSLWYIFCWASFSLVAQVCKMLAFKYDRVTRVYPVYYMEPVFCLIYDIVLFDEQFYWLQLLGISLVFAVFSIQIVNGWLA